MTKQIKVTLTEQELRQLSQTASEQCRRPHDHARYIILNALGLATNESPTPINSKSAQTLAEQGAFASVNP